MSAQTGFGAEAALEEGSRCCSGVLVLLVLLTSPSSQPSTHQHARAKENLQVLVILTETAVFPHLPPSLPIPIIAKDFF